MAKLIHHQAIIMPLEIRVKVTDPQSLNEDYNKLFRAGDIEGLVSLYEASAVLCPAPGQISEATLSKLARRGADGGWRYVMDLTVALS